MKRKRESNYKKRMKGMQKKDHSDREEHRNQWLYVLNARTKINKIRGSAIIVEPNSKILVLVAVQIIPQIQHFAVNAVQNLVFKQRVPKQLLHLLNPV